MADAKEIGIVLGAKENYEDKLSRFRKSMSNTKSETERAGSSISSQFGRITNAADKLNNKLGAVDKAIGRTFKIGAAGVTAYAGVITRDLLQLNSGVSKINTLYAQTAQSQKVMTKEIIDTWKLIPQNFENITQSMYDAISASLDPKNAASAARKFAMGAVAGGTDNMSAVVKAVMGTKNAYGMDDSKLTEIMDVQFATIKAGIVEYEELAASLATGLMPAAQASGIDYKAVYAGLAQLTKNNMPANVSATSMTQLFNKFTDKDGIKAFKNFGVDIQDAQGHTRDFLEITKDLFNEFEKRSMTSEARKGFLKDLLGSDEAARAILPLVQNVKDFEKTYDSIVNKSKGTAKEAYIDQMDNIVNQVKVIFKGITGIGLDYAMQFEPFMDAITAPFKKKMLLEMDIEDINEAIGSEKDPKIRKQMIVERELMIDELNSIDLTPIDAWKDALTESVNNLKALNPELAAMAEAIGTFFLSFMGEEGAEKRDNVGTGLKVAGGAYLSVKALTALKHIGDLFNWLGGGNNGKVGGLGSSIGSMMVNAGVVNINGTGAGIGGGDVPASVKGGSGMGLLINALGTAAGLAAIYAISKNAIDKNEEYLKLTPQERTAQNVEIMKESRDTHAPRGHEKYPSTPAKSNKINFAPRNTDISPNLISAMKDTMDKMKASEMTINTTVPVEVKSTPTVNVKVLLDGSTIPGRVTSSVINTFSSTKKEIERSERRMGGPTK